MTRHYQGLGSASDWLEPTRHDQSEAWSSVWNFGASFTDVISRGNQCRLSRNVGCFLRLSKCVQNMFEEISHSGVCFKFPSTHHKSQTELSCFAVKKKLAYSSWFHQRFEHFDVISTVNKSVDHRIFLSICKQNIREFDKRLRHWS